MKLSAEELASIEKWAALAFPPEKVELILGFASGKLSTDQEADEAYQRGLLTSEAEVWKSIFEHAKAGSSPAQTLAIKRIEQTKANTFLHG
jgi:hypothetical protein